MKCSRGGFTLIEICLALAIALVIVMIAVPSLSSVLKQDATNQSFEAFDQLVRKARALSTSERRTYLIGWSQKEIVLRPELPENPSEAEGVDRIPISQKERYTFELPAALSKTKPTLWSFWPSGTREPATISYEGPTGSWSATFPPLAVKPEVNEL